MFRHLALIGTLATLTAGAARAQGWIEIERPIRPGLPSQVVRVSSTVRTAIEGRVARVEVEEQFRNAGGGLAEGSYLYPLPGEAVFTDFALWMGEDQVHGEVMSAEQARGIYEDIVRRLRDPALLTLEGHGLVRARIFPLRPGETRRVVLRYTQVLDRAGDALRLRYAIGDRQVPPGRGYLDQPAPTPTDAFRYTVTVPDADAYGTPYSPTHRVTTRRSGDRLEITLDPDAAGDVEIFIPVRRGLVGTSVVTNAPGGEDGYFMLLVSPPAAEDGPSVPRDLTLVLDVSGSMSGEKIEQAKAALRQAIQSLRPDDRFRLVAFSTRVVNFRDGFVPATAENLQAARAFLDGLAADGGTNIAGALDAVLGADSPGERLPIVVFVTDGVPTVGEQSPDRIASLAGGRIGRARIFTVGVGFDVNTYLLDRLAAEGRGSAEYVPPGADIETAMSGLLGKIQHPALVNLRLAGSPVELTQTYPATLPDLFYGEELVVFGRYRGTASGPVVVTGERNGRTERFTAEAAFPATAAGNDFVPRLWASRRIGDLTRQIRIEGATPALIEEVRSLGLRYGILTEYTSYLVQEPRTAWNQPAPMPASATLRGGAAGAAQQTGRDAFANAKASAALGGVSTLAAADRVAATRAMELAAGAPGGSAMRRAGGRLFVQSDSVWTDASYRDSLKVTVVAPFSDAYFALVRALPEIAPCLSVGDRVVVAGRRTGVKIAAGGLTAWRTGELETLVRAFRGV
ncbi:MAG TPA: VIT domain-containing protein [Gemmatimonadales bacterium]|nr:VIT domain-containing protein [Gemmatimonadales bacterium]